MNQAEAKEVLLLYRPGTPDEKDPEVAEALEMTRQDPELGKWFAEQQAFHLAMKAKFSEIEVPPGLKRAILARQKVVRPPQVFWQQPVWAAAAIFLVLGALSLFVLRPSVPNRFAHYRERMVSAAVRNYGMDVVTQDPNRLRQFLAGKGAPSDYDLTRGLAKLQLKGGGMLRWRGNPVSMVCFDRGTGDTLFLFVMKQTALKDPAPSSTASPHLAEVDGLMTASWSRGPDTYVLAGLKEPGFVEKYLADK